MGRCKSLGSLKLFLSYVSQLSGARILVFSHPELLSAHCREWLKPYGFQIADTVFLPGCPPGSEIHIWSARMADDCGILAY